MKAKIHITLKNGVLDPQGKAIEQALGHMGFNGVTGVRQGKYIEIDLASQSKQEAAEAVEAMCSRLLANNVIENYRFDVSE